MRLRILLIAVLALVFVTPHAVGQQPAGFVVQHKSLVAKKAYQTWVSKDPNNVWVHVYRSSGEEIPQRWVNRCRANYHDPVHGLYVWIWIKSCRDPRSDYRPYVVRYLSVYGHQRFSVWLTTSPNG